MPYSRKIESLAVVEAVIENRLADAKQWASSNLTGGYFPNFVQAVANANLQNAEGLRNTLLDILAADVEMLKE